MRKKFSKQFGMSVLSFLCNGYSNLKYSLKIIHQISIGCIFSSSLFVFGQDYFLSFSICSSLLVFSYDIIHFSVHKELLQMWEWKVLHSTTLNLAMLKYFVRNSNVLSPTDSDHPQVSDEIRKYNCINIYEGE